MKVIYGVSHPVTIRKVYGTYSNIINPAYNCNGIRTHINNALRAVLRLKP